MTDDPSTLAEPASNSQAATRFADPWFRQYDCATDGYTDSMGFTQRLPLRLRGTNVVIHGLVDAEKMWA